jgi:hypothetical protein
MTGEVNEARAWVGNVWRGMDWEITEAYKVLVGGIDWEYGLTE